jgi:hypothetical protein
VLELADRYRSSANRTTQRFLTTPVGGAETTSVVAAVHWRARFRIEAVPEPSESPEWSECRVVDVTLTGATVELLDASQDVTNDQRCLLQIDSIAADDVGIVMRAVARGRWSGDDGRSVLDIEFDARREESLMLHLLVRLHALV